MLSFPSINPYQITLRIGAVRMILPFACALLASMPVAVVADDPDNAGRKAYDYFCYQCHGYAGDARTLAARYLEPPPRDFTAADPAVLTRERMLQAVTEGREGTGMKSFSRVLDASQREAVVDYVRQEFMKGVPAPGRYHTAANGWPDHEEKYSAAYPFATGELATDTPREHLDPAQSAGLELFKTTCVSCHDKARVEDEGEIWRARSTSFPRRHYDHRTGPWDAVTSATPYQRHDVAPDVSGESTAIREGQEVFLDNCAFCHGADGTGRNWIGSFMEPPAADLTGPRVAGFSEVELRSAILLGVPGGTMPAWRGLLDARQLDLLFGYLEAKVIRREMSLKAAATPAREAEGNPVALPQWRRLPENGDASGEN